MDCPHTTTKKDYGEDPLLFNFSPDVAEHSPNYCKDPLFRSGQMSILIVQNIFSEHFGGAHELI